MYEAVLKRIMNNQGNLFHTITKLPFTYEIKNGYLQVSRTNYSIPLSDIQKAYNLFPCSGPSGFENAVRGPSYIWAILNDIRIYNGHKPDLTSDETTDSNTQVIIKRGKAKDNKTTFATSLFEKYEDRFRMLEAVADKQVVEAVKEAIQIAATGSDAALIPLAKTLEGNSGLLSEMCAENTQYHLSWGRDQETDKLYKAVQHVSSVLPSYVISALQNFVRFRNHAAHDMVLEADKPRNFIAGLEAYFQFIEWYYAHCKKW